MCIKKAVECAYAANPELKWYLALTDSIIATIQCANTKDQRDKLDSVCMS